MAPASNPRTGWGRVTGSARQGVGEDLAGDAVRSATGAHWEEAEPDYWNMNTDIRTTAIVVWALSRLEPESELLPGAVRWLMAARQEGYWETTQATAWSYKASRSPSASSGMPTALISMPEPLMNCIGCGLPFLASG